MRSVLAAIVLACVIAFALLAPSFYVTRERPDPGILRRRAVDSMREILRSQDAYATRHPENGFATTLAELGPSPGAGLIDAELAGGEKFGYQFTLTAAPADSSGRVEHYTLEARWGQRRGYRYVADESTFVRWSPDDGPPMTDGLLLNYGASQDGVIGFAPDGRSIAIVSGVRVKFVDTETGKETIRVSTPAENLSFGFADDGRLLAWRIAETAKVWDMASGRETFTLARTPRMRPLAFSGNGRWLAGTTETDDVKVWDVAGNTELRTLSVEENMRVTSIVFSANGLALAASGEEEELIPERIRRVIAGITKVWDVATGNLIGTMRTGTALQVAELSPDGTRLAAKSGASFPVELWDVAAGQAGHRLLHSAAFKRVNSVAFSPDGRLLATGGEDYVVKVWDTANGNELRTLFTPWPSIMLFGPSGTLLLVTGTSGARVWDTTSWRAWPLQVTGADEFLVRSAAFTPDGRAVAGSDGRSVKVWDALSGMELRTRTIAGAVTFSSDGRLLVVQIGGSGVAEVFEAESGVKLHTIESGNPDLGFGAVFSPEQRWLAAGDRSGTIRVWDIATGRLTGELRTKQGNSTESPVSIDANGRFLVASGTTGNVTVWDIGAGAPVRAIRSGPTETTFFRQTTRLGPDGRLVTLALSDRGGTLSMLDVAGGRQLYALPMNARRVALSRDGRVIATTTGGTGPDGEISLLDAATGSELTVLKVDTARVDILALSLSRDGRWLAAYGSDYTLRIWNLTAGRLQSTFTVVSALSLGSKAARPTAAVRARKARAVRLATMSRDPQS